MPCIAAGGINSARTMKAAFELGAEAVQVGTAFVGTVESSAIPAYKVRIDQATDTSTTLTKSFSGRWARGIRNKFMEDIEQSGVAIPSYPLQNSLTTKLRKLAQQHNDSDYTTLWAGQSAKTMGLEHTAEVFMNLVKQYDTLFK
jgi:nitronate monooxygenase